MQSFWTCGISLQRRGVPNVGKNITGLHAQPQRWNVIIAEATTQQMIVHVLGTKVRKQILKIKSENKISYTEAVKQYRGNVSSTSPHISSRGEFPPLLSENHSSQLDGHKSHSSKDNISAQHHSEEIIETEQRNSLTTFSNSVHFLAFLAEVIQETILAPKRSESIDVFQVIAKVADGKIVDLHWMQKT